MRPDLLLRPILRAGAPLAAALLSACAALPMDRVRGDHARQDHAHEAFDRPLGASSWPVRYPAMQGFVGASIYDTIERSGGGGTPVESSDDQFPLIGGGAQWKLGGDVVDVGLEGMFGISGRENVSARTSSGVPLAVDVDVVLIEVFGGPFASTFLGRHWRAWAAAGPQMSWVEYDQRGASLDDDGSGFGTGLYARVGLEYEFAPGLFVGFSVRWTDWTLDLGSGLGDLDLEGVQYVLTVTQGL